MDKNKSYKVNSKNMELLTETIEENLDDIQIKRVAFGYGDDPKLNLIVMYFEKGSLGVILNFERSDGITPRATIKKSEYTGTISSIAQAHDMTESIKILNGFARYLVANKYIKIEDVISFIVSARMTHLKEEQVKALVEREIEQWGK